MAVPPTRPTNGDGPGRRPGPSGHPTVARATDRRDRGYVTALVRQYDWATPYGVPVVSKLSGAKP
jgi:hypothetical protein